MSNLLEPPQRLTGQLRLMVEKGVLYPVLGTIVLADIIDSCCAAAAFRLYLGSTIPALKQYACYAVDYTLGTKTFIVMGVFFAKFCWYILRLLAPKQVGSSISKWDLKLQASFNQSNGKLGRASRTCFGVTGALYACNGLSSVFSWKAPDFSVYQFVCGLLYLRAGAESIYAAYKGRLRTGKANSVTRFISYLLYF
ncbi:hypothetical protein DFH29DRAFT_923272 [Suillus ampliporus]|nr:hypothetical protein DFH29DRAFT_923272 [Suillus ampliporus]